MVASDARPKGRPGAARTIGFLDGALAPWSGLRFIVMTPAMWPLAAVPVAIALILLSLLSVGAISAVRGAIEAWLPSLARNVELPALVVRGVLYVVGVVFSAIISLSLAKPLSGPALERIVRAQERAIGAREHAAESIVLGMFRSLRVTLVSLSFALALMVLLFLIDVVFPPAAIVTTPLKLIVSALTLSWDLLDYPLSLRQHGVRTRFRWFREHLWAVLGFGLALALLFIVPCAGLLLLPAGVAGGARLVVRTEDETNALTSSRRPPGLRP